MKNTIYTLLTVLVLLSSLNLFSNSKYEIVYGPKKFYKLKQIWKSNIDEFSIESSEYYDAKLVIENNNDLTDCKSWSCKIKRLFNANNVEVKLNSSTYKVNFNKGVFSQSFPINLKDDNNLLVKIKGNVLSSVEIRIEAKLKDSHVDNPPKAEFTVSKSSGVAPELIEFDASLSSDDNGIESYNWDFGDGSTAQGVSTSHTFSNAGTFVVKLIVTDSKNQSSEKSYSINISENEAPIANILVDPLEGPAPLNIALNGLGSSDSDGQIMSYLWTISDGTSLEGALQQHTIVEPGTYSVQLTVVDNKGKQHGSSISVNVTPNQSPIANFNMSGTEGVAPYSISFDASESTDPDGEIVSYKWDFGDGTLSSGKNVSHIYNQPGQYIIILMVTDNKGAFSTASNSVNVKSNEPVELEISLVEPNNGDVIKGDFIQVSGSSNKELVGIWVNSEFVQVSPDKLNFNHQITNIVTGDFELRVLAKSIDGEVKEIVRDLTFILPGEDQREIPDSPSDIAPPLNQNTFTPAKQANIFLVEGTDPIQKNTDLTKFDDVYVGVIRGKVLDEEGAPIAGVKVTIPDNPEFGYTHSREDGEFDLLVNSKSTYSVHFSAPGFLRMVREVYSRDQDYSFTETVRLSKLSKSVTKVALNSSFAQQIIGEKVSDQDGERQSYMIAPTNLTAKVYLPTGEVKDLESLSLRVSEYTKGENGKEKMPAPLPGSTAYTYAIEISADEALSENAYRVEFNKPLVYYFENFIGAPVGTAAPLGYYDFDRDTWVGEKNGRVVKIISVENGLAKIDVTGQNSESSQSDLDSLGINQDELQLIASRYEAGTSLIRFEVPHLTPWDCNWPYTPPSDAGPPTGGPLPSGNTPEIEPESDGLVGESEVDEECACPRASSSKRASRESISVSSRSNLKLNYNSELTTGYVTGNDLKIPLSGDTIPSSVDKIKLTVDTNGIKDVRVFSPSTNLTETVSVPTKDAYGREIYSNTTVNVKVEYVYKADYVSVPSDFESAWAKIPPLSGRLAFEGNRQENTISVTDSSTINIEKLDFKNTTAEINGWGLDILHYYDLNTKKLYKGDGSIRDASNTSKVLKTIMGNSYLNQSVPYWAGTESEDLLNVLINKNRVKFLEGPNGELLIAYTNLGKMSFWEIENGKISFIKNTPEVLAIGRSFYASEKFNKSGDIIYYDNSRDTFVKYNYEKNNIFVYGGTFENTDISPDGTKINEFNFGGAIQHYAGDLDGNLYVSNNNYLFKVDTSGVVRKIGGNGEHCAPVFGEEIIDKCLYFPTNLIFNEKEKRLYFISPTSPFVRYIAYLDEFGVINKVSWKDFEENTFDSPSSTDLTIDKNGIIYVGSEFRINTQGYKEALIENQSATEPYNSINSLSSYRRIEKVYSIGNSVYFVEHENPSFSTIILRELTSPMPNYNGNNFLILSKTEDALYEFDSLGKHLSTLNAKTGKKIYQFEYNEDDKIVKAVDRYNREMSFTRAGDVVTGITDFDGVSVSLNSDSDGRLSGVTNSDGKETNFSYESNDGLLSSVNYPTGAVKTNIYENGKLKDIQTTGDRSFKISSETVNYNGNKATYSERISPEGYVFKKYIYKSGEDTVIENLYANNTFEKYVESSFQTYITKSNGVETIITRNTDPNYGALRKYTSGVEVTYPSGLKYVVSTKESVITANSQPSVFVYENTLNGKRHKEELDVVNLINRYTSAEGIVTEYGLNSNLEKISESYPGREAILYTRNDVGEIIQVSQGNRISLFEYTNGYVTKVTNPLLQVSEYVRNSEGKIIEELRHDGQVVKYDRDANGNLIRITTAKNIVHELVPTVFNLFGSYLAPLNSGTQNFVSYFYDKDNRTDYIQLADNSVIDYMYNELDQLDKIESTRGDVIDFNYNSAGQVAEVISSDGIITSYIYDGSLLKQINQSGEIGGDYDLNYNSDILITSDSVKGSSISYTFDNDLNLKTAGNATLEYLETNGDLSAVSVGSFVENYSFNQFGEISSFDANGVYTYQLERDLKGRIIKKTETILGVTRVWDYSFDANNNLDKVKLNGNVVSDYDWDLNNNREGVVKDGVSIIGSFDTQDKLISYNGNTYTYYLTGELQRISSSSGNTELVYDAFGSLKKVTLPSGDIISYIVDGHKRRVIRKLNGQITRGFIYKDNLNPIAELDENNNIRSRFVYATKANVPDYMIKGGVEYKIVSDHLGSVRLVVNTQNNQVVQRMDYDEFGRVLQDTNPGFQPFGFAGGIYDPDTKLVRFGARDYDAETGRWTAKDPILFNGDGPNLYGYVLNDPINAIDPNGLESLGQYFSDFFDSSGDAAGFSQRRFWSEVDQAGNAAIDAGKVVGAGYVGMCAAAVAPAVGTAAAGACLSNPGLCSAALEGLGTGILAGASGNGSGMPPGPFNNYNNIIKYITGQVGKGIGKQIGN